MKNLKMLQAALAIAALSILVGCSDQITSSGETGSSKKDEGVKEQTSDRRFPGIQTYNVKILLKGYGKYSLNKLSTGLDKLYSINISNLSESASKSVSPCNGILIYSTDYDKFFDCSSSGFDVSSLVIENTGSSVKQLSVSVTGLKNVRIHGPKEEE